MQPDPGNIRMPISSARRFRAASLRKAMRQQIVRRARQAFYGLMRILGRKICRKAKVPLFFKNGRCCIDSSGNSTGGLTPEEIKILEGAK